MKKKFKFFPKTVNIRKEVIKHNGRTPTWDEIKKARNQTEKADRHKCKNQCKNWPRNENKQNDDE